ncbi:type II secretion system ATPase GspE [Candidatus Dependentiae bacterium]|nr:type II secretion system ATPase GspE [Candidatus Dependentiae bacterium]MBU4386912.1 type II secretion system ATPase GspE [Candidatus Dependentiae bacterium]MCG2756389.1 type II secretion system ATPase GspE [Candidatus Dependentiae bacterium]
MNKKNFQDILLELNLISKEQHQSCVTESAQTGKPLSQIIIEKKLVSKMDIAKVLAQEVGFVYVDKITEQMVNTELLSKIPLKFLRQHVIIPILFEGFKTVVTSNPRDIQPLDDISLLLSGDVKYGVSSDDIINAAINKYYPLETSKEMMEELKEEEAGEIDLTAVEERDILEMAQEAPIVKLVNHMIFQAVKEDASDIHIEAFEKELRVRYRIDGVMYQRVLPPKRFQGAIVSRIKIMANLDIAEKRLPQDGRIQIKVGDKAIDIRVSILPCNYGERVVMRLLDKTKGAVDLEHLDFSTRDLEVISRNITRPNGIILISGPTGSGKTTTLYSILSRLNKPDINIITVEDPVEYTITGVNQVQVKEDIGLTFAAALRSILRQDPDVVLIGEIRDKDTAQIATQAALTGHVVLSTIHTNSSPATITRLIDMGIEPFLISSSVICIMSQRLVRKLCDKCKQEYKPEPDMIKRLGLPESELNQIKFYKSVGCEECFNTGYRGRLGIFEVMEVDDEIAHLIVEKADANVIKSKAIEKGMVTLAQDGIRRVKNGQTSLDEVLNVAYIDQALD